MKALAIVGIICLLQGAVGAAVCLGALRKEYAYYKERIPRKNLGSPAISFWDGSAIGITIALFLCTTIAIAGIFFIFS